MNSMYIFMAKTQVSIEHSNEFPLSTIKSIYKVKMFWECESFAWTVHVSSISLTLLLLHCHQSTLAKHLCFRFFFVVVVAFEIYWKTPIVTHFSIDILWNLCLSKCTQTFAYRRCFFRCCFIRFPFRAAHFLNGFYSISTFSIDYRNQKKETSTQLQS